jgi:hypothetical protein
MVSTEQYAVILVFKLIWMLLAPACSARRTSRSRIFGADASVFPSPPVDWSMAEAMV